MNKIIKNSVVFLWGVGLIMPIQAMAEEKAEEIVNIYSYRQSSLVQPLLDEFTKKTGIKTKILFSDKGLDARVKIEGENSPADVLLTTDISRLYGAKALGISQSVDSKVLNQNIPIEYRDNQNHWFGLTRRARIVYASRARVPQNEITYEELTDPKWRGKICTRSGQHVYTLGLIASIIAHKGETQATKWLEGVRDNLAHKPKGNDRAQVKSIYNGECDISLGNTYYMGKMETNEQDPEQMEWAKSVKLLFPNSADRGTHVNLSGMVMARHAPNKENAQKLMEFLSRDSAQRVYSAINFEYPVKIDVEPDARTKSWGQLTADKLSLEHIAQLHKQASELVDKTNFDYGPVF